MATKLYPDTPYVCSSFQCGQERRYSEEQTRDSQLGRRVRIHKVIIKEINITVTQCMYRKAVSLFLKVRSPTLRYNVAACKETIATENVATSTGQLWIFMPKFEILSQWPIRRFFNQWRYQTQYSRGWQVRAKKYLGRVKTQTYDSGAKSNKKCNNSSTNDHSHHTNGDCCETWFCPSKHFEYFLESVDCIASMCVTYSYRPISQTSCGR